MRYFLRTADGKEYGPVDQEVLVQWAQAGRITSQCEVRSELMKKGNPASRVPFLEDILRHQTVTKSFRGINIPVKEEKKQTYSLTQSGNLSYVSGTSPLRFGAWIIDTLILLGIGAILMVAFFTFLPETKQETIFSIFSPIFINIIVLYYTLTIGMKAQTAGQYVMGLMVIKPKGDPVLFGRAFAFSFFYLLFFWSSFPFIFCMPSKRAIQDYCSGTRIVKTAAK